jgi:hypothetical protein
MAPAVQIEQSVMLAITSTPGVGPRLARPEAIWCPRRAYELSPVRDTRRWGPAPTECIRQWSGVYSRDSRSTLGGLDEGL